jgi:hypothetical protein
MECEEMRIAFGSGHIGFELKNKLMPRVARHGSRDRPSHSRHVAKIAALEQKFTSPVEDKND